MEINEIECPSCGAMNNLTDMQIDGCLMTGRVESCCECKGLFVIGELEYSVEVVSVTPAPSGSRWGTII